MQDAARPARSTRSGFTAIGGIVEVCSAAEFDKFLLAGIDKWAKGIRFAGVKTEG
jgi:hypothetical protein